MCVELVLASCGELAVSGGEAGVSGRMKGNGTRASGQVSQGQLPGTCGLRFSRVPDASPRRGTAMSAVTGTCRSSHQRLYCPVFSLSLQPHRLRWSFYFPLCKPGTLPGVAGIGRLSPSVLRWCLRGGPVPRVTWGRSCRGSGGGGPAVSSSLSCPPGRRRHQFLLGTWRLMRSKQE